MEALYIHIPFCTKVCTYCDFYKMVAKDSWKEKYVDYLLKELEMRKDLLGNIKTVYIGGGTPSSLKLELQTKIFEALKSYINVNDLTEFTIEANPDDITETLVKLWQENGINRISLGIQSLKKKKLKKLGRTHNSKTVKKTGVTPLPTSMDYKRPAPRPQDYNHRCTVCGRTDTEFPDLEFRYCSRCSGYHCYCEDHINNHEHIEE